MGGAQRMDLADPRCLGGALHQIIHRCRRLPVYGLSAYLHHGELGSRDLAAVPDAEEHVFDLLGGGSDADLVLFGHTHVQFTHKIGHRTFINPGSVGRAAGVARLLRGLFEDGVYEARQVQYDPALVSCVGSNRCAQ